CGQQGDGGSDDCNPNAYVCPASASLRCPRGLFSGIYRALATTFPVESFGDFEFFTLDVANCRPNRLRIRAKRTFGKRLVDGIEASVLAGPRLYVRNCVEGNHAFDLRQPFLSTLSKACYGKLV
ncbi:MAG TPA: hypothetical protein VES91_09205, partial [Burkholderiaceae bacterium]|nr:hypothetical protein [Burkholderiaceae bacterium]